MTPPCTSRGAEGRARNVTFALHRRSAEQGNVVSLQAMADAYFDGDGVAQDWARAAAIYYEVGLGLGWDSGSCSHDVGCFFSS